MYIVIIGGGKVGYYLAKSLLEQSHEILVIENNRRRYDALCDELSSSILLGDGCEVATLEQAGMGRADVVVAVTGDDEDNLVACQVAKHKFNVAHTIARINNPKNERIFRRLGIDVTVSSTELILSQIEQVLPAQSLVHLLTLRNVGVSFVEMRVPAGSPAIGQPIRDLGIPDDCIFPLVIRGDREAIIPFGATTLEEGDLVIAVASETSEGTVRKILFG